MRILLDTHAFLWFVAGDTRVGAAVRSLIVDPANVKVLSIATPWEIAIKVSVGKLNLSGPFETEIPREIARGGSGYFRSRCPISSSSPRSPITTAIPSIAS